MELREPYRKLTTTAFHGINMPFLGNLSPRHSPARYAAWGFFAFAGRCSPMIWLCPTGSAPAPHHMNPETTPEQDKPEPFALDLNDETPLPVICELSEDGTCEACQ